MRGFTGGSADLYSFISSGRKESMILYYVNFFIVKAYLAKTDNPDKYLVS